MYCVYAIKNEWNKIYIGQTSDLEERLKRHNGILKNKKSSYTHKNKGTWILFYKEELPTRKEAMAREKYLKTYRGRIFLKNLLK
ncbi:MAG: GIY-YIG nuclease family protein [Patescibacteria group bacterium]